MIDEWKKGAKYWDHAWNPVIGCKPVSEGCANCYAAGMAERFPELQDADGGFAPHAPKGDKRPPKHGVVFVGNMTDIFGYWNSDRVIFDCLHSVSETAKNLVLTKRVGRMSKYFYANCTRRCVWYGMTAENQERYNERIKDFRNFQSPFKWLSAEPLLGPIDMQLQYIPPEDMPFGWVVVGAESGPNRRPCRIYWVRSIVHQCRTAGIKVFVKQLDINGKLEKDIEKFPADLQIRQVPWRIK